MHSTTNLLSAFTLTKEQAEDAFALLKCSTLSYIENLDAIAFHSKLSEKDRAAACEAAFRLKENDNWKLIGSACRSWREFCKNEFRGRIRQLVDQQVSEMKVEVYSR